MSDKNAWTRAGQDAARQWRPAPSYKTPPSYQQREFTQAAFIKQQDQIRQKNAEKRK